MSFSINSNDQEKFLKELFDSELNDIVKISQIWGEIYDVSKVKRGYMPQGGELVMTVNDAIDIVETARKNK